MIVALPRHFVRSAGLRKLSLAQALVLAETPSISDGINPLFWPLPKEAVINALLTLADERVLVLSND